VAEIGMPTVVVASDAFKGSLTSLEVADAVRLGVLDAAPRARLVVVPVADGGEGTVAAALAAGWRAEPAEAHGPTGEPVGATLALRSHAGGPTTVLVELADVCGLGRLPGGATAPLTASSRGLGEAVRAALDLGPAELVVGVGGSASTDGGAGMLAALGARLLDADGLDLPEGGAALADLARVDLTGLDPRLTTTRVVLAADVDSPLLGPTGAAAVYGPQKGATAADVMVLEAALTRWAEAVTTALRSSGPTAGVASPHQLPGSGAAGGVGLALLAVLGAERRSGVDVVLDMVGLDDVLPGADLVVTGEGALDAQTLAGKAVAGVARRARAHGIPVVAVCGRCDLDEAGLAALGVAAAYPLTDLEPESARAMSDARELVRRSGARIARDWLSDPRR
jgi:glycerate 2-kinase